MRWEANSCRPTTTGRSLPSCRCPASELDLLQVFLFPDRDSCKRFDERKASPPRNESCQLIAPGTTGSHHDRRRSNLCTSANRVCSPRESAEKLHPNPRTHSDRIENVL